MDFTINTTWSSTNNRGYTIPDQPYGTIKSIKVICVGAGMSGISLAHSVETHPSASSIHLTVYECAPDVGGTWFWNQYPGCRCDVPSAIYQMPWAPKVDWDNFYAKAEDIFEYYKDVVHKHNLAQYIRLSHTVLGAKWDDSRSKWIIRVKDNKDNIFTDECDIFINATGILSKPKYPQIPTLSKYKGTVVHTARWPQDLDINESTTIAVLGGGASGIQVIAEIQPKVRTLYHWIRSKAWVTLPALAQYAGPGGYYTEEQKDAFKADPKHALKYRKLLEYETNQRFRAQILGTPEQSAAVEASAHLMRTRLQNNERLMSALIPKDFSLGCQRPLACPPYLDALRAENVHVYTESLLEMTEDGFIDNEGVPHQIDIFVCATGFDTSYRPSFPIVANGVDLRVKWADFPYDSYMSTSVHGFPNYFTYFGPFGPASHGSTASAIEAVTVGIMSIVDKLAKENISSISVKLEAAKDFNEHQALYVQRMTWSGPCHSWSKPASVNEHFGDQAPTSCFIFPGNRLLFIEMVRHPRWEDYDYTYGISGNRFACWGNGFTMREFDGRDPTYYIGLLDGKDEFVDFEDIKGMYTPVSVPP